MARKQGVQGKRNTSKSSTSTRKTETKPARPTNKKTTLRASQAKPGGKRRGGSAEKIVEKAMAVAKVVRTSSSSVRSSQPGFTIDDVRERAYHIYLRRGRQPGDPTADWFQAERELRELHGITTESQ